MNLEERIEILKNANQIDDNVQTSLRNIINMFWNDFNIKLTEENASMLITHLAVALQRIKQGKCEAGINEDAYKEIEQNEFYGKSVNALSKIAEICNIDIPHSEQTFIIMHLCTLFQNNLWERA
ncbi:PRD domain-containing protein [Clostridium sp. DMHC 10]|uniref:PRD domain-containing protein n=1 Tax=Clostridium sp. DMHC 10 TaxID=747377 RepID=UPI00069F8B7B|nr:PRD domain-containing protein [Clostridium sp. DMHC 10]